MKKYFFFILITLSAFAFAKENNEYYYVCVGSFRIKSNAQRFSELLNNNGINASFYEANNNGVLYRVFIDEDFSDIKKARASRNKFSKNKVIKNLGLKGLWVCKRTLNKKLLMANAAIPINKDTPYSVKLASYKNEDIAQKTTNRLKKSNIDAYVVKTYDEDEYFNFDVNAGAFNTKSEANTFKERLEKSGLKNVSFSDYNTLKSKMVAYDKITAGEEVIYDESENKLSNLFSENVTECIREFPINKNYEVQSVLIADLDNLLKNYTFDIKGMPDNKLFNSDAITVATYCDTLYNRTINIIISSAKNPVYDIKKVDEIVASYDDGNNTNNRSKLQFALKDGYADCNLFYGDNQVLLAGVNDDKTLFILMTADNFTKNDILNFLNDTDNDSTLLVYPELRHSLLVLPKDSSTTKRDFLYFTLSKVSQDYATERNNSAWSRAIVGQWDAKGAFAQDNKVINTEFFDMNYNYGAKKIHNMFMEEKEKFDWLISDSNHASTLNNEKGWYIKNANNNDEFSFSKKSYIIATYCDYEKFSEKELKDFASDLQIW